MGVAAPITSERGKNTISASTVGVGDKLVSDGRMQWHQTHARNALHTAPLQVIDFDDAGYGWHLFEIATSLYFIRRDSIYEQARQAVIEGYRKHRTLSESHAALLPMFLAARGTTYLGWVHTRAGEPAAAEMIPALIEFAAAAAEDYLNGG